MRREEILAAAEAEVTKRGFAHTRVGDVADSLGVSSALIFYHFGSKEKLFAQTLEHAVKRDLDRLDDAVAKASGPVDGVRRMLQLWSPQGDANGWTVWVDAWSESLREPEMRAMSRRLDVTWKEALADQIRHGNESGVFHCADPEGAAWRLSALLDGLAVQATVHDGVLAKRQITTWVRALAAAELGVEPGDLRA